MVPFEYVAEKLGFYTKNSSDLMEDSQNLNLTEDLPNLNLTDATFFVSTENELIEIATPVATEIATPVATEVARPFREVLSSTSIILNVDAYAQVPGSPAWLDALRQSNVTIWRNVVRRGEELSNLISFMYENDYRKIYELDSAMLDKLDEFETALEMEMASLEVILEKLKQVNHFLDKYPKNSYFGNDLSLSLKTKNEAAQALDFYIKIYDVFKEHDQKFPVRFEKLNQEYDLIFRRNLAQECVRKD